MDITPLISSDNKVIQSVKNSAVKVNGEWLPLPVIVTPTSVMEWDGQEWSGLSAQIILMGTGENSVFPDTTLRQKASSQNLNIEWMSNPAAARTYNVLMSEGRDVMACFL